VSSLGGVGRLRLRLRCRELSRDPLAPQLFASLVIIDRRVGGTDALVSENTR
jgi:hypothetical protein